MVSSTWVKPVGAKCVLVELHGAGGGGGSGRRGGGAAGACHGMESPGGRELAQLLLGADWLIDLWDRQTHG